MVEGRVVVQAEAFHVTDAQAAAWGQQGIEARDRLNPHGVEVRRPLRQPRLRVLERLLDEGRLRQVQVDAGLEIRAYWHGWLRAHGPTVSRFSDVPLGGSAADPPWLRNLGARFKVWAASASARKVRGDLSAQQIVEDLCIRDWSPTELRREYRISNARALRVVQESLLDYARLAGWQEALTARAA
jgi:hypothetical protein